MGRDCAWLLAHTGRGEVLLRTFIYFYGEAFFFKTDPPVMMPRSSRTVHGQMPSLSLVLNVIFKSLRVFNPRLGRGDFVRPVNLKEAWGGKVHYTHTPEGDVACQAFL